tara:strand:+ start:669 stop:974 length:306 start_codon:yes stop_codon:yes gene_type:complete
MALEALGAEQVTVDNTAGGVALTAAEITSKVVRALIQVETAEIRFQTDSGTTITAGGTEGSPAKAPGAVFYIYGVDDLRGVRFIRTGSTSGVINVIYEGVQ